jgi:hypothetical protein
MYISIHLSTHLSIPPPIIPQSVCPYLYPHLVYRGEGDFGCTEFLVSERHDREACPQSAVLNVSNMYVCMYACMHVCVCMCVDMHVCMYITRDMPFLRCLACLFQAHVYVSHVWTCVCIMRECWCGNHVSNNTRHTVAAETPRIIIINVYGRERCILIICGC